MLALPEPSAVELRFVMRRKILHLLNAISRAKDANDEAMALIIELAADGDDMLVQSDPAPPLSAANVIRETEKSGPRTPFKLDSPYPAKEQRSTSYTHTAVSGKVALSYVRKLFEKSVSEEERKSAVDIAGKLIDQGFFTLDDIKDLLT